MVAQVRAERVARRRDVDELRCAPMFAELDEEALADVVRNSSRRTLRPGLWMMDAEETREHVLLVARGSVRLYRSGPNGREATVAVKHAGEAFDFLDFDRWGNPRDCADVLEDGTVIYSIPHAYLLNLALSHPCVLLCLLRQSAAPLREARQIIADQKLYTVAVSVAHALVRLAGPRDAVEVTRVRLATIANASREDAGKALKALRAAGLIAYEDYGHTVRLLDKDGLDMIEDAAIEDADV